MAHLVLQKRFKNPLWSFYAALSTLFLLLGAWAGAALAGWPPIQTMLEQEEVELASVVTVNGQRNLLVIGVDRLDQDSPRLESLWLLLYLPGRSPVTLMPLYPRPGSQGSAEEDGFVEAFRLARSGDPSAEFFDRLRHEQVWWSGYVLLDEAAVAALVDQLGGLELDGRHLAGAQALQGIPQPWEDQAGALQGQVALLRSACRQAGARVLQEMGIAALIETAGGHLRGDIDLTQEARDWLGAAGPGPDLECEFPLLDIP